MTRFQRGVGTAAVWLLPISLAASMAHAEPVSVCLRISGRRGPELEAKFSRSEAIIRGLLGGEVLTGILSPRAPAPLQFCYRAGGWAPGLQEDRRRFLLRELGLLWGGGLELLVGGGAVLRDGPRSRLAGAADPAAGLAALPEQARRSMQRMLFPELLAGNHRSAYDGGASAATGRLAVVAFSPGPAWSDGPGLRPLRLVPAAGLKTAAPPSPAGATGSGADGGNIPPRRSRYPHEDVVRSVARETGVDHDVLRAVIQAKSGFDARWVSGGAYGLMGVSKGLQRLHGRPDGDLLDPEFNVRIGALTLARLLRQFDGDMNRALAAYQAGPAAVIRSGGIPDDRRVKEFLAAYRRAYHGEDGSRKPVEAVVPPKLSAVGQARQQAREAAVEMVARTSRCSMFVCHEALIQRVAGGLGVDADLMKASIQQESQGNPWAESRKGARGLTQLMPETAALLGVVNITDPYENVRGGTRHMKHLLEKYGQNRVLALAAYNAGESAVDRYGGKVPPYPETVDYIRRVSENYHRLTGKNLEDLEPYLARPPRGAARKYAAR